MYETELHPNTFKVSEQIICQWELKFSDGIRKTVLNYLFKKLDVCNAVFHECEKSNNSGKNMHYNSVLIFYIKINCQT